MAMVPQIQTRAEVGDSNSQNGLGYAYLKGALGFPKDPAKAIYWLRKSAEQANVGAQRTLAHAYAAGLDGVPQDFSESAKWFERAATQGDSYSKSQLAAMYMAGNGVPKDLVMAKKLTAEAKNKPSDRRKI